MRGWRRWAWVALWACAGWISDAAAQTKPGAPPAAPTVVTVGLLAESQPFHVWPAGGKPSGYDIELLQRVAREAGLKFDYLRYERWDVLLQDLAAGKVNLVTATARTPEREVWMAFTRSYASASQGFAGRRSETSVSAQPDLAGRRLALVQSFATESIAAERFALAPRLLYATTSQALDAVERGEADFVLGTAAGLRALLAERRGDALAVLRTFGFAQGQRRLGTVVSNFALRDKLDAALGAIEPAFFADLNLRWLLRWEADAASPAPAASAGAAPVAPLRVAYLPFDPPYTYSGPQGAHEGIGIELMKAAARRAGIGIERFEPVSLPKGLMALQSGRIDVMLGLTDTAERRQWMSFVGPYRNNPVILVSRERSPFSSLEQLGGRRLAMIAHYFAAGFTRSRYPDIEIVSCEDFSSCMALVVNGQAEAALYGLQGTYARLAAYESAGLRVTGAVTEVSDEHNLGLSLARADIGPRLRDGLAAAMREDLPRIEREWHEREAQPKIDWTRVRQGLAIAAALLLLALAAWAWHWRRLRREIERTQAARADSEHYLAFMAHEVRNSLQSVAGAVALLRGSSRPEARQQPLLDALGRSARSTLGLLNGLLDRHRLQAGRLSLALRPESLERSLMVVMDEVQPAALAKGLTLRFERGSGLAGWWQIDALRLQQIVRNLLVNAVKFSDEGEIVLRASLADSARGAPWRRLVVDVIDEGPGLAADQVSSVFDRLESKGGDRPGSGLGLNLSRDLARALGGSLEVQSTPGAGARFTLAFDAEPAHEPPPPRRGHVERVLVVEDSPVYALLLGQAFINLNVRAHLVESIAAAREALTASVAGAGDGMVPAFDLVLSDTNLGDGHVGELLRWMREAVRPGVSMPPVICISADFVEADATRLMNAGAIDLLTKDSDVAAFASRVLRSYADHHGPPP